MKDAELENLAHALSMDDVRKLHNMKRSLMLEAGPEHYDELHAAVMPTFHTIMNRLSERLNEGDLEELWSKPLRERVIHVQTLAGRLVQYGPDSTDQDIIEQDRAVMRLVVEAVVLMSVIHWREDNRVQYNHDSNRA